MWSTCVVSAYSMRDQNAPTTALSIGSKPCSRKSAARRALEQGGENVPVPREPLELLVGDRRTASDQLLAEPELPCHDGAARPRDDVRTDLRQPALREVGIVVEERLRDRELEHAVAEELEPLVRRCPVGRPRGVGEDVLEPLLGELLDQAFERSEADRDPAAATGVSRRSRRPVRRS